jgi:hypothetical protein
MAWRVATIILLLVVFIFAVASLRPAPVTTVGMTESTSTPSPLPVIAIDADRAFNETGTLVFYPNNVGPVPYLFYQDARGTTVAKALIFDVLPPTDFSSWTGARISVSGIVDREHVIVSRVAYVAAP